ncbi:MAG: hypothetical protein KJ043_17870 [Anaerolineae bacterium]|nr:hypothetical protein [Anaerolineae bacterium]
MSNYSPVMTIQDEVMTFLLSSPTPEAIIAFHASDIAQARLQYLLDTNRNGALSDEERAELDEATHINHFVMLLKAKAHSLAQIR